VKRRKRRAIEFVYTEDSLWGDHPPKTRRNVEELLQWLSRREESPLDYDSPIGRFVRLTPEERSAKFHESRARLEAVRLRNKRSHQ
jgi:hypothetical protein